MQSAAGNLTFDAWFDLAMGNLPSLVAMPEDPTPKPASDFKLCEIPRSYQRTNAPKPNLPHPPNVCCTHCHDWQRSHDLLHSWAEKAADLGTEDVHHALIDMNAALSADVTTPQSRLARGRLTLLMLKHMTHDPGHRKGCFKKKDNKKKQQCRYGRPQPVVLETVLLVNDKPLCTCTAGHAFGAGAPDSDGDTLRPAAVACTCPGPARCILTATATLGPVASIEIAIRRAHGSEYISNHNLAHLALFRCNVNTRAVFANPGQLYYVTAYAMKLQENKDMCLKMVSALERAIHRHAEASPAKTAGQQAYSTLFSLANAATSSIEVPSTVAALWLRRNRNNNDLPYFSHDFTPIHLNAVDRYVATDAAQEPFRAPYTFQPGPTSSYDRPAAAVRRMVHDMFPEEFPAATTAQGPVPPATREDSSTASLPEVTGKFVFKLGANSLQDYEHRPVALAHFPYYFFVAHYVAKSMPESAVKLLHHTRQFLASHPHRKIRALTPITERVPLLTGPRLPDATKLDLTDANDPSSVRYCRLALALHQPWSHAAPLNPHNDPWPLVYAQWNPTPVASHMLQHHQQYHDSKSIAGSTMLKRNLADAGDSDSDEGGLPDHPGGDPDPQDYAHTDYGNPLDAQVPYPKRDVPPGVRAFEDIVTQPRVVASNRRLHADLPMSTKAAISFADSNDTPNVVELRNLPVFHPPVAPSAATQPSEGGAHLVDPDDVGAASAGSSGGPGALSHAPSMPRQASPAAAIKYLEDHVLGRTFHVLQAKAFVKGAAIILRDWMQLQSELREGTAGHPAWLTDPCLATMGLANRQQQQLIFLSGPAGSGKSTILRGWRLFAEAWGMSESVQATATIGTAAILVDGCTTYAYTQAYAKTRRYGRTTVHLKSLLIIDEVSLMGRNDLAKISKALNAIGFDPGSYPRQNRPFGGASVVFVGDMNQLPPIKKDALWQVPLSDPPGPIDYKNKRATHNNARLGSALWRSYINQAMLLTYNFRAARDPDYQDFLLRLRDSNTIHPLHLQKLRACRVTSVRAPPLAATHVYWMRKYTAAANSKLVHIIAAAAQEPVYRLHSSIILDTTGEHLPRDHGSLRGYTVGVNSDDSSKDTDPLPYFDIYVGMPVSIVLGHNHYIDKNIANGSQAHVIATVPALSTLAFTEIQIQRPNGTWYRVRVLESLPTAILVHNPNFKVQLQPHGAGVCAITPKTSSHALHNVRSRCTITHFGLRHVFARTCHILQGSTLAAMVLGQLCPNTPSWLYTALSRVASWADLYILDSVNIDRLLSTKSRHPHQLQDQQRVLQASAATFAAITYLSQHFQPGHFPAT